MEVVTQLVSLSMCKVWEVISPIPSNMGRGVSNYSRKNEGEI